MRIHVCANEPCTAMWKMNTYTNVPPPNHLRAVPEPDVFSPVAAPPPAEPAVAAPPPAEPAVAAPPPAEPATVVEPASVVEPPPVVEPEVQIDQVETPGTPTRAGLKSLQPPAPATPIDLTDEGDVTSNAVAEAAFAASADAARHRILTTLLALARAIRRPRAFVGYSAFVLMGLLKKCQLCIWEGVTRVDLLETFTPWAKEHCTRAVAVTGIVCKVMAVAGGSLECVPISEEHLVGSMNHYVGGCAMPESAVAGNTLGFDAFYASLGVAVIATVADGDCGLDVMCLMLGQPQSLACRTALRIEISDYLILRIGEPWMQELMVALQEIEGEDLKKNKLGGANILAAPSAPAPAFVEPAKESADPQDVAAPTEETFEAMRWASRLESDSAVLSLIRSLPKEIVEEQVQSYRKRAETAVAQRSEEKEQIEVSPRSRYHVKMLVAARFHMYCDSRGIVHDQRIPYGLMATFIKDNLRWKAKQKKAVTGSQVRKWYNLWRSSPSNSLVAVADQPSKGGAETSLLKSKAPQQNSKRQRGPGAGRPPSVPLIRQALYEWWAGIRYAIDWQQMVASRRSRGKKNLARFPRSALRLKVQQLLQDLAYVCLLNGSPLQTVKTDSWWFKRWEGDYGLSMRKANRKYQVPRSVLKERLEVFWVNLFRVRLFIFLVFGYDPLIANFDQSPFHHNETGSQDKPTLGVRGSIVPVVEGNSDVKSRWTANLMTWSRFTAVADSAGNVQMPPAECMFKGTPDAVLNARLQGVLRSRGFPAWFTVTVGPKGSYREHDVVAYLEKHLEEWREGRDWRILLADDYSAHKSENVFHLCWQRGYILLIHGGGATPVAQTPDTDLNEYVRRDYGDKEARLLLEKMRDGQAVPKLNHEECMLLMLEVLSDTRLHKRAAEGYKKVGQSIDLHGKEDALVCREAGTFWREETTDKFTSMRPKIDAELVAVAEEYESRGLTWCCRDVRRLITPYTPRKKVDAVLANLGEDYYQDDIQAMDIGDDDTAVAEGVQETLSSSSDDDDGDDMPVGHVDAAVAGDGENTSVDELESTSMEIVPLSASQADAVHQVKATIAALESTIESLRAIGSVRSVQCIEMELKKERRKERQLTTESPAVAEGFLRLRRAEEQGVVMQKRLAAQQRDRKREAAKANSERDAAVADLKRVKKNIAEMECLSACRHAIKTFTLDALGAESSNAGGVKARKNRFEVLDRLSRLKAGLSAGQKNDWPWFKESWDAAMVAEHRSNWASVFAGWVQNVLEDERSTAFSLFVYNETCRVFHASAALHVPGS